MNQCLHSALWAKICSELDHGIPAWRDRIIGMGQVSAIKARHNGQKWSDQEIFEGIIKAVLSNNIDWSKVEPILPNLHDLFHDFDLAYYAGLPESDISAHFIPWFTCRKAGSMTLKRSLVGLVATAKKLREYSIRYGGLENFHYFLLQANNNDLQQLAWCFGSVSSRYKLPSLGIPIAAEALKNIGFDVAKPDRHINRAMGCFGLVNFKNWKVNGTSAPTATESEILQVMQVMANFASAVSVRTAFLDNAVWLLCAKSGFYASNDQLLRMKRDG